MYRKNLFSLLYNTLILLSESKTLREALAQRQLASLVVEVLIIVQLGKNLLGSNYK